MSVPALKEPEVGRRSSSFVADAVPIGMHLAVAGALVAVVWWAWPIAWQAFGGDVAAMLPASMMCVLPVGWSLTKRAGWPGLLVAVVIIAGLAAVLSVVTYPVLLVFVVLVAMFVHFTTRRVSHVR